MPAVLERVPTAAFVEAEEEFPVQSTGASAFAEDYPEHPGRFVSASEAEWVRWQIAILLNEVERLKTDVHKIVREIPRFQTFRASFEQFIRSNFRARAGQRQNLADRIRTNAVPSIYIQEVLRRCSTDGPEGLDIGIDFLTEFGAPLRDVFDTFVNRDRQRWPFASLSNHVNDDVCYMLLRGLARSSLPISDKLPRIADCLHRGTASIREAATHALGDLGGDDAKKLLGQAVVADSDPMVRESAKEALDDLNS
jgi:hypothetical protein